MEKEKKEKKNEKEKMSIILNVITVVTNIIVEVESILNVMTPCYVHECNLISNV